MSTIEADLDKVLVYHTELILSYEDRNPIDELHKNYLGDPVFELFGFTDVSFTKKRWTAGFANSCATNLGRFTDKAAKIILKDAFDLTAEQLLKTVSIKSNNKTETEETDGVVLVAEIPLKLRARVQKIADRLAMSLAKPMTPLGIGFELRGRYGKNDDTLLQKDEHMADAIRELGAVPVMATFSICNAPTAINRLKRSWAVVSGNDTVELLTELTGFDLIQYLKRRSEILAPIIKLLKQA